MGVKHFLGYPCIFFLVLAAAGSAQAVEVDLYTTADVYIFSAEPDRNFNTSGDNCDTQLIVGHYMALYNSLLKFDLSSLPQDASIQSIELNICGLSTSSDYVYFYRAVDDSWDENTVTWNSYLDSMDDEDLSLRHERQIDISGYENKEWLEIPLAGDFSDDLDDDTLTLLLSCGEVTYGFSQGVVFTSKEYTYLGDGDYDPYLKIIYTPEPATLALLVMGSIVCLRRRRQASLL